MNWSRRASSLAMEHRDHNFAFVFPLIDWLFGASWLPKHWPPSYGINGRMSPTMAGQFFDPLEPAQRPGAACGGEAKESVSVKE